MKYFLMIFLLFTSSCNAQTQNYDNLMQHPEQLQDKYVQCQGNSSSDCEIVRQAARDFLKFVNERSDNPEKFGQQVLQLQTKLAALPKQSDNYSQQELQLKILYAVIASTSTE